MIRARGIFTAALLLWGAAFARDGFDRWVEATHIPPLEPAYSRELRDREGDLLRAFMVENGRWRMAADRVAPTYLDMLVAYEDKRFFQHSGVDPRAMLRALWQAVTRGRIVSGASTLTMQAARLLEGGPTGEVSGKIRQIRLALALERRLSKAEILDIYLARAPFGGNLEGVRAAALAWFGKEPARLTEAEAALLVALPQAPETRRPDAFPEAARRARDIVLGRMVAAGVLTPEEAEAARRDPVPNVRRAMPQRAALLADRLLRESDARVIRSTLDGDLQASLEALAARAVAGREAALSVAILVANHRSGEILASVGSAGYGARGQGFVDMTTALRSPGSTLKPLIYALAMDEGLVQPETVMFDRPMRFGAYAPQNFDGGFRGPVSVRRALQMSLNVPVVALADRIGPARIFAALKASGAGPVLPGEAPPGLAMVLGGVGVSPLGLTELYAMLARGGEAGALRVTGRAEPPGARVVSEPAAWQVANILAGVPPPPNAARFRLPYKTGTSYGYRDAWAVGFDAAHVVTVWIGRPDGTPVPGAFGADAAAPLLFEAFARVKPAPEPLGPPPPGTLMLSNAALPPPLRSFGEPDSAQAGPELAFPPDGALVARAGEGFFARVEGGRPPYTWLVNGEVRATGLRGAQAEIAAAPGHMLLTVVDANGRAARVRIEVE
ncbi:MAG: penicillin-binding protein 1C [Rhodobacterales bacterium]|nr:MAG: penicillin-binding protein 1C [Rhodobacterales bacterium]